jgi:hypothetical protein
MITAQRVSAAADTEKTRTKTTESTEDTENTFLNACLPLSGLIAF